ncbi:MAG TPA: hypothetical protein VG758_29560 [Hyphomicrobiaceae bacterium]|nr:hypothetical protein [Hyphomicrobiaceae bacterium]
MAVRSVIGPEAIKSVPLVVWAARASLYFVVQGALVLLAYAYYGLDSDPQSFPLGFRLDPIHAGVHLVWGLIGAYIGFFRPRFATAFVLAFAAFYTGLAILGTFTNLHFGMQLGHTALFHWVLVAPVWAVGLRELWIARRKN